MRTTRLRKFCCMVAVVACSERAGAAEAPRYPAVDRRRLSEEMARKAVIVVDANGSESWKEGHIPGALDFEAASPGWPDGLPKDKGSLIITYCGGPRCMAWKQAAVALSRLGYSNVAHFPGGISEWAEAGMPVESGLPRIEPLPMKGAGPAPTLMPSCRLSPEDQSARFSGLRKGLLARAEGPASAPGKVRLRFRDTRENVEELVEFIRFERACCSPLRFALDWAPEGGALTLEVKGPPDMIEAMSALGVAAGR